MIGAVKRRPLVVASFAVAVLLAVGALTFAGPCIHDDGSPAACHAAAHAVIGSGIVAVLTALIALFARSKKLAGCMMLVAAAAGLFASATPGTVFNLCMMQTMRCWTIMKPFALVCGGVLLLCALVAAIMLLRERGGDVS